MSSRIVINGRTIGTGRVAPVKCECGELIVILGRCQGCHEALRARRLGLPPKDDAERKRLAGILRNTEGASGIKTDPEE